jgi:hypothetical protein
MTTRKKRKTESVPFPYNNNIKVFKELKHGKDEIVPGSIIRFKNRRGTFKFISLVINYEKNVSWIDCLQMPVGPFRSFYVEELKGIVKPKRTGKKKEVV